MLPLPLGSSTSPHLPHSPPRLQCFCTGEVEEGPLTGRAITGSKVSRNGLHEITTVAGSSLKTAPTTSHTHPLHFLSSTIKVRLPGLGWRIPKAQQHICFQGLGYPEGGIKHGLLFSCRGWLFQKQVVLEMLDALLEQPVWCFLTMVMTHLCHPPPQ